MRAPIQPSRPIHSTAPYRASPGGQPGRRDTRRFRWRRRLRFPRQIHPATAERVYVSPAPRDIEQLDLAHLDRHGRVNQQVIAYRLQSEQCAEYEERRPS